MPSFSFTDDGSHVDEPFGHNSVEETALPDRSQPSQQSQSQQQERQSNHSINLSHSQSINQNNGSVLERVDLDDAEDDGDATNALDAQAREELLQFQEQLPNAIPDQQALMESQRRFLNSAHSPNRTTKLGSSVATASVHVQTDPIILDNLPSNMVPTMGMPDDVRPTTQGGRRFSAMRNRRESRFPNGMAGRRSRQMSKGNALELEAPKRLQARENERKLLGRWKLFWYDLRRWYHLKRQRRADRVPVWRSSIKRVEGYFGSGLASFFTFLRWLFLLNTMISIIYICFVILPMAIRFDYDEDITETFNWFNVIDGAGAVGETWIFYGGYREISGYRMDLAYIFVPLGLIAVSFFVIVRSAAKSGGGKLITIDNRMPFGRIVLASWDYSVNEKMSVKNLTSGVSNALKDAIAEQEAITNIHEMKEATLKERLKIYGKRAGMWFVWMIIVAGCFAGIWFVVLDHQAAEDVGSDFFTTYAPVLLLSFINGALPLAIKRLTNYEDYKHPRTAAQMTTVRVFLLRIMTIYALLYGFFEKTNLTANFSNNDNTVTTTAAPLNITTPAPSVLTQDDCAATVIGKEIYKLVLVDTVVGMLQRLAATIFWYLWLKRRVELDLVQCVLHLVYRQGLVWVGMAFCPAIPVLAALSNVIYFYFYFALVRRFCRPPQTRWDSSRNTSFFLWCLGVTLFFMAVPLAWVITEYDPDCGVYASDDYHSWYDGLRVWVLSSSGGMHRFFSIITNPMFLFGIFIMLSVWISLLRTRVSQSKRSLRETEWELSQTREDKKVLLVALQLQQTQGNAAALGVLKEASVV